MKYARTPPHADIMLAARMIKDHPSANILRQRYRLNHVARWLEYTAAQLRLQDELDKPIMEMAREIKKRVKIPKGKM